MKDMLSRSKQILLFEQPRDKSLQNIYIYREWLMYLLINLTVAAQNSKISIHHWINKFQSDLINSKKIQKNVKFGLQTHINMENKMNGSDRLFVF